MFVVNVQLANAQFAKTIEFLTQLHRIVFPVHHAWNVGKDKNNTSQFSYHWTMMEVNFLFHKCFVYNSLANIKKDESDKKHRQIWQGLLWLLTQDYIKQHSSSISNSSNSSSSTVSMHEASNYINKLWKLVPLGISAPQQIGGTNCGMIVLENCDYVMDDLSPCFSNKRINYCRARKTLELLKGNLLDVIL